METLQLIGFFVLGILVTIGIIRVIINPYTNLLNFFMEIMLLDYLGNILEFTFDSIGDLLD